jgi:hypothetical protein
MCRLPSFFESGIEPAYIMHVRRLAFLPLYHVSCLPVHVYARSYVHTCTCAFECIHITCTYLMLGAEPTTMVYQLMEAHALLALLASTQQWAPQLRLIACSRYVSITWIDPLLSILGVGLTLRRLCVYAWVCILCGGSWNVSDVQLLQAYVSKTVSKIPASVQLSFFPTNWHKAGDACCPPRDADATSSVADVWVMECSGLWKQRSSSPLKANKLSSY